MRNPDTFLINLVLARSGDSISVEEYVTKLVSLGYTKKQAISSLGGVSGRSADIKNGMVTRR